MKSRSESSVVAAAAARGPEETGFRELLAGLDRPAAFALTYTALVLSVKEYFLLPGSAARSRLPALLPEMPFDLACGFVWAGSSVVLFLLLPLLFLRLAGMRPRDAGWSLAGAGRHLVVYAALFAVMVPALAWAASRPEFTNTYPFVASARRSKEIFWRWEVAYLLQFLALEAFFRGYLLFTLARRLGASAVPVMTVPYAMIHFHKPFAECLGAIGAGWILGLLALRYRSFFGGVLLHSAVAFTMDFLSVRRAGLF
jgi:membrane protease YdiL (CAAX protease family)